MKNAIAKQKISDQQQLLTNKLRAFGSIPRLKIMMCLGESPKNVTQLTGNCGLTQSAVSQHLSKLKTAGLLQCHCQGRERVYFLTDKKTANICKYLLNLLDKQA